MYTTDERYSFKPKTLIFYAHNGTKKNLFKYSKPILDGNICNKLFRLLQLSERDGHNNVICSL
jgi:hypothetical protein